MHQMESVKVENLHHYNSNPKKTLHIAMFPFLAFGHITPFINLSNALVSHTDNIQISFLTTPTIIRRIQTSFTNDNVRFIPLTLPQIHGLQPGLESTSDVPPSSAELLTLAVDKMQPQIKSHLSHLKPHFIFFDFAQHWIPELCSQLGTTTIKSVHFSVFSAIADSYITSPSRRIKPPSVNEMKQPPNGEYPESNLIKLKTFEARNLLYVFKTIDGGESVFDRKNKGIQSCDAIVYKTCFEMEGPYINYLKTQYGKPVLHTGLLLPNPPPHSTPVTYKTFAWLDQFQPKSVIFCSFGSETFLETDQIQELALGLELTGLPFILVISSTITTHPSSSPDQYEVGGGGGGVGDVDNSLLPRGYLDRVKGKGIVMTGWVPQQEILMHNNIGCYVTHCGLSSLMEGLMGDCQLILVPFKGDQFLNAKLMSLDLGVGVEVNRRDEDGWFGKYDIVEAVRKVMGDVDKETGGVRVNQKKWREFVMNREVGEMYVTGLVEKLKDMVEGE